MTTALTTPNLTPGPASALADWHAWLALQVAAGELAPTSAATYQRGMGKFADWAASAPADKATILHWKASLQAAGHKPGTINTWLAGVKAFYAWAVDTGRMSANPAAHVKGAKRTGTATGYKRDALTDAEVVRVLALANPTTPAGARDAAIVALMAYTAARSVEIHRADLQDLHTDSGRLVLRVQGKGRAEKDEKVVIASPQAEAALRDWLAVRGTAPGPLFTALGNRSRGRLSLRAIRGLVKALYRRAGVVGNKTTHSLRHAAITSAVKHGAPVQKVQAMARHANLTTTMIYYHEQDRITNPAEAFVAYEAR